MKLWKRFLALFGLGASVAVASVVFADPSLSVTFAQEQAKIVARWAPKCDVRGCPDAYAVVWFRGGTQVAQRTVAGTSDSVQVAPPAFGDSVRVEVRVQAVRRGALSSIASASRWIKLPDAAPPPVDSLVVDTLAWKATVDSVRIMTLLPDGREVPSTAFTPSTPLAVAEGDSVRIAMRMYGSVDSLRVWPQHRTTWETRNTTASTYRVTPTDTHWQDTAWIVALACNCEESGNATNPPTLNLNTGQYQVRDASGRWRPVTPRVVASR